MAPHRTFTDDDIAHAVVMLQANQGNALKTAKQLGVSRTTLRGWAGRNTNKTGTSKVPVPELLEAHGTRIAGKLERISDRIADRVLEAIERAPIETAVDIRNMLVSGAIAIEKSSFARGGPTQRTESVRISLVAPDILRSKDLRIIESTLVEPTVTKDTILSLD